MDSEHDDGEAPAGTGKPAPGRRYPRLERSRYLLRVGDELERVLLEAEVTRDEGTKLLRGLLREWSTEDEEGGLHHGGAK